MIAPGESMAGENTVRKTEPLDLIGTWKGLKVWGKGSRAIQDKVTGQVSEAFRHNRSGLALAGDRTWDRVIRRGQLGTRERLGASI